MSWAAAGANVLGALLDRDSQQKANWANKEMAKDQMGFQEVMSNTAHQRARDDMYKAGLNPLLAAGASASSPAGASSVSQPARTGEGIGRAVSSAIDASRLRKEVQAVDSQTKLNEVAAVTQATQQQLNSANAKTAHNQATKTAIEAESLAAQLPSIKARSKLDARKAGIDDSMLNYDSFMNRLRTGLGAASDATSIVLPKIKFGTDRVIDSKTGEILQESRRH